MSPIWICPIIWQIFYYVLLYLHVSTPVCRPDYFLFLPAFLLQILTDSPVISLQCDNPPECDLSVKDLMWHILWHYTQRPNVTFVIVLFSDVTSYNYFFIAGLETRSVSKQSRMDLVPFPTNCQVRKIVKKNKDFFYR